MNIIFVFVAALVSFANASAVPVAITNNLARSPKEARLDKHEHPTKRARIAADDELCNEDEQYALEDVLQLCNQVASQAADAAVRRVDKMEKYFHTRLLSKAKAVQNTFKLVADACSSPKTLKWPLIVCRGTKFHNEEDACESVEDVDKHTGEKELRPSVAETIYYDKRPYEMVLLCPIFWRVPPLPTECHRISQVGVLIHEMTHIHRISGTLDYAYEHSDVVALNSSLAMKNAETYSMFATAIFLNAHNIAC